MTAYIFAALAAITAALVAIFGKIGLEKIDPTAATAVRGVIMAAILVVVAVAFRKLDFATLASFGGKEWLWIVLAAVAGAASWLFYFIALKQGDATAVAAIDRLSIVFVLILAAFFLGESITIKTALGGALVFIDRKSTRLNSSHMSISYD